MFKFHVKSTRLLMLCLLLKVMVR